MSPRPLILIALCAAAMSCGPRGAPESADSRARRLLRAMLQAESKSVAIRSRDACNTWTVEVEVSDGRTLEGKLTRASGPETADPVRRQFAIDDLRTSVSKITIDPGGRSVSGGVGASLCVIEEAELVALESGCLRFAKDDWVEVWCGDAKACNALGSKPPEKGDLPLPGLNDRPNCFDE